MRRNATAKPKTKSPPATIVVRRRTALMEIGLDHGSAAKAIQDRDGIPTTRQTVSAVVNGRLVSGGLRVERNLVAMIQERFRELGKPSKADRTTLEYFGWGNGAVKQQTEEVA